METSTVSIGSVLEEVDKRVLALTAGATKMGAVSEVFHSRRHCRSHGPKRSTWILDPWKGDKNVPG